MAEAVTTGTTGHSGTGQTKVFGPLDPGTFVPQLVWLVLTFSLLYFLLKRFALPRVGEVIEARRERIQRDLERAKSSRLIRSSPLSDPPSAVGGPWPTTNGELILSGC